eukprot:2751283-Rhodomonas_salina.1
MIAQSDSLSGTASEPHTPDQLIGTQWKLDSLCYGTHRAGASAGYGSLDSRAPSLFLAERTSVVSAAHIR